MPHSVHTQPLSIDDFDFDFDTNIINLCANMIYLYPIRALIDVLKHNKLTICTDTQTY